MMPESLKTGKSKSLAARSGFLFLVSLLPEPESFRPQSRPERETKHVG